MFNVKSSIGTHGHRVPVARISAILLTTTLIGGAAGCASNADPKAMVIAAPASTARPFPAPLQHAMCVRNVAGGEETNALWVSKVNNAGFKDALAASLTTVGLSAAADTCLFPIDVNLLGLSQPAAGFDLTVTAHVNYKVYQPGGEPLLLQTLDSAYTATMSEAFVANERLKKANEGAIRTSISELLDKLRDSTVKDAGATQGSAQ